MATMEKSSSEVKTSSESEKTCCCGQEYPHGGGVSSHYCPAGERLLCRECAAEGKSICPTHQVRVRF
jgi:hypothetical protein